MEVLLKSGVQILKHFVFVLEEKKSSVCMYVCIVVDISKFLQNHHFYFLVRFLKNIYLKVSERERDRQKFFQLLFYSLENHNDQGWVNLKPGVSSVLPAWMPGAPAVGPSYAAFPVC